MKRKVMSKSNRIFYIVNTVLLMICLLLVAMPILNVVASSLSSPSAVIRGQVSFWPKGWNIDAYKEIFSNRSLLTGYKNSIIYTIVGTCVNIVLTIMAAYPLSVKDFIGRKVISALFIFVMIFTAPLIPTYLNVKNLGLLDSMWALILPGAISVYNMIIARTYFQNSIPGEMLESARLDGCDDIRVLVNMVLPLSKSILAVLVLYYAIAHWNSYFDGLLYINDSAKQPLQTYIYNLNIRLDYTTMSYEEIIALAETTDKTMNAAKIIVAMVPILVVYPFIQKYFTSGMLLGAVKG